jgi:hypothetical protein
VLSPLTLVVGVESTDTGGAMSVESTDTGGAMGVESTDTGGAMSVESTDTGGAMSVESTDTGGGCLSYCFRYNGVMARATRCRHKSLHIRLCRPGHEGHAGFSSYCKLNCCSTINSGDNSFAAHVA